MGVAFLLRSFAFGDIDHGAHAFDDIAGRVEYGVTYFVDMPDRAVGKYYPVFQFVVRPFTERALKEFCGLGSILRMNALEKGLDRRNTRCRIEAQQAIGFVGPVRDLSRGAVVCPTARMAQPLCFRQIGLATPQSRFRAPSRRKQVCPPKGSR